MALFAFRWGGVLALLAFASMIIWASIRGALGSEFAQVWSMPWGKVSIADLYLGLLLFSAWVWWREGSAPRAAAWTLSFLLLGNLATFAYVLWALRSVRSAGDLSSALGPRSMQKSSLPASVQRP